MGEAAEAMFVGIVIAEGAESKHRCESQSLVDDTYVAQESSDPTLA